MVLLRMKRMKRIDAMSRRPQIITDKVFDMPLPWDEEAEKGVLSCLMNQENLLDEAVANLPEEAFYGAWAKVIYSSMIKLRAAANPVDLIHLSGFLRENNLLEQAGGNGFLAELLDFVPSHSHFPYYVKILKDKLILRRVCAMAVEMAQAARGHVPDAGALLASKIEGLMSFHQSLDGGKEIVKMPTLVDAALLRYEEALRFKGRLPGISTGFAMLDQMTGGFRDGNVWCVGGAEKSGKTAFVMQMLKHMALNGTPCANFSMEVSADELTDRMFANETQMDSGNLLRGTLQMEDLRKLTEASSRIAKMPLFIRDASGIKQSTLFAEMRLLVRVHGIKVIALDYGQLVTPDTKGHTREREVSELSQAFKAFCNRHSVAGIFMTQLNQNGESRESKSPQQDADKVIYLRHIERPDWEKAKDPWEDNRFIPDRRSLQIKFQRNGPTGPIGLRFDGPTFTFTEMSHAETQDDKPPF